MVECAAVFLLAFILDLMLGDPRYRLHPIRLMGHGILLASERLKGLGLDGKGGGVLLVLIVQIAFLIGYLTLSSIFQYLNGWLGRVFDLFVCYSCLALKDLLDHADRVRRALEAGDAAESKAGIAMIVGRDVRSLDDAGIVRAAVETLAENFVDGFLSPVFWYVCGGITARMLGLPEVTIATGCMLAFKATSTLDSMVGYRNAEFMKFGWAGAKLDDIMNFVPARLSLGVFFLGAVICRLRPMEGIKTARRDRLKHDSPNSAHAESFVAGALHVRLGGPTVYAGVKKEKPWLGRDNPDPQPIHIRKTGLLLTCAAWVGIVFFVCLMILVR